MPMKIGLAPTRPLVMKHLYAGVVNLSFLKKDGTLREMNATLVTSKIPEPSQKESSPNDLRERDSIVCWDIDVKGWRTFKVSTIESYNGLVKAV